MEFKFGPFLIHWTYQEGPTWTFPLHRIPLWRCKLDLSLHSTIVKVQIRPYVLLDSSWRCNLDLLPSSDPSWGSNMFLFFSSDHDIQCGPLPFTGLIMEAQVGPFPITSPMGYRPGNSHRWQQHRKRAKVWCPADNFGHFF